MAFIARDSAGRLLHRVVTPRTTPPSALCSACGWSEIAEPPRARAEARALAQQHLRRPPSWPVFHLGRATRIGGRRINADHHAVFVDDSTGTVVAWAVADGIGDNSDAAEAACLAATSAVQLAYGFQLDAADALLAAGDLLRDYRAETRSDGDAVMIVALAEGDGDGYQLAWVGDCRGYQLRDGELTQLTVDHTAAENARAWLRDNFGDDLDAAPDRWRSRLPRMEHIVTTSVARATETNIGTARTEGPRGRLVLTSDGVHKPLPPEMLAELVATTEDPRRCAHLLTLAGGYCGGTDNVTAMVIDPVHST